LSGKKIVSYLAERRYEDIPEFLAYACGSWTFHFIHADNNAESAELKDFFERHLLRWMDCLSILGKLGTAMHSLHKLESWAKVSNLADSIADELYL
jgi:TorA maturation chaperone TorD